MPMKDEISEADNEVITYVLTYGYPSGDDDVWEAWRERGYSHATRLARDTAAHMDIPPGPSQQR